MGTTVAGVGLGVEGLGSLYGASSQSDTNANNLAAAQANRAQLYQLASQMFQGGNNPYAQAIMNFIGQGQNLPNPGQYRRPYARNVNDPNLQNGYIATEPDGTQVNVYTGVPINSAQPSGPGNNPNTGNPGQSSYNQSPGGQYGFNPGGPSANASSQVGTPIPGSNGGLVDLGGGNWAPTGPGGQGRSYGRPNVVLTANGTPASGVQSQEAGFYGTSAYDQSKAGFQAIYQAPDGSYIFGAPGYNPAQVPQGSQLVYGGPSGYGLGTPPASNSFAPGGGASFNFSPGGISGTPPDVTNPPIPVSSFNGQSQNYNPAFYPSYTPGGTGIPAGSGGGGGGGGGMYQYQNPGAFTYNPTLPGQAPLIGQSMFSAPTGTQSMNAGQDPLMQMMSRTYSPNDPSTALNFGGYDNTNLFSAIDASSKLALDQQVAALQGSAGSLGQRFGTAMNTNEANLRNNFLTNLNLQEQQIGAQSFENAQNRALGAATSNQNVLGQYGLATPNILNQAGQFNAGAGQASSQFGAQQGNIYNNLILQAMSQAAGLQSNQLGGNTSLLGILSGLSVPQGQPSPWASAISGIGSQAMLFPFLNQAFTPTQPTQSSKGPGGD